MEDLKERMRKAASGMWSQNLQHVPDAINEGIAAIDRITAERNGLASDLEKANALARKWMQRFADRQDAERDGYRAALELITVVEGSGEYSERLLDTIQVMRETARAALATSPGA